VGSLRRGQGERRALLEAMGALWVHGVAVAWDRQFAATGRHVALPAYAWHDRERCWLDGPTVAPRRGHPLLGDRTPSSLAAGVTYWTNEISIETTPYLEHHRVGGQVVFPAAGYVEMATRAASEAMGGPVELRELKIQEALLLTDRDRRLVQLVMQPSGPNEASWQIASTRADAGGDTWTIHARGRVLRAADGELAVEPPPLPGAADGWEAFDAELLYARFSAGGLDYGDAFRGVQRGWRRPGEAAAELACVGDAARADRAYGVHPGLLDAALQVIAAAMTGDTADGLYLPAGMDRIRITRPPEGWPKRGKLWSQARCVRDGDELRSDVWLRADDGEVLAYVAGFRARRVQGTGAAVDDHTRWLYEFPWEEQQRDASAAPEPRNWLVLADDGDALGGVVEGLRAQGNRVVEVRRGDAYMVAAGARVGSIDPVNAGHFTRLLRELTGAPDAAGWGVLHGWGLDDTTEAVTTGGGMGWRSLLTLVQALAARDDGAPVRLVVMTRGARSVVPGDRVTGLAQAPVLGVCKTVVHEHPQLACVAVDVGEAAGGALDPADVDALIHWLGRRSTEDELALRAGRQFVPRLARSVPRADEAQAPTFGPLHPDGVYVVTGGFGGIGMLLARWLAARGARHLALLGRREPDDRVRALVDELRASAVEATALQADVSDAVSLGHALAAATAGGRPIRGVFHLAGSLDNAVLSAQSEAQFARVLAPKVQGTWNLHQATLDQPLDHFVLFSSVASVFGAPGQANHGAANAFLDALAAHRAASGAPALSINWGAWAEVGEAAEGAASAWVVSRGLHAMPPSDALDAFARAAGRGAAQLAVVAFGKRGPDDAGILDRPLFARLVAERGPRRAEPPAGDAALTRAAVLDGPVSQRVRLVASFLRELVANQTGFAKAKIDLLRPLTSLGLDSLMTLKLKNRIESALGVSVPATLFLQGINIAQLAAQVVGMMGGDVAEPAEAAVAAEPSAAASRAAQRRAAQTRRSGSR
jgi:acyl transferase domain-containing protein/acyl carrier protein